MKKVKILLIMFLIGLVLPFQKIKADELKLEYDIKITQNALSEVGLKSNNYEISNGDVINICGENVRLRMTFKNVTAAIEEIKKTEAYLRVKKLYGLEELNVNNYSVYEDAVFCEIENGHEEMINLRSFLNILENNAVNEEIKTLLLEAQKCVDVDEKKLKLELAKLLLPSTSYMQLAKYEVDTASTRASTVSVAAMTNYATRFYSIVNPQYGYWSNADCTNFASQIFYSGGMATDVLWKPYTTVWVNANSFANYFKTRLTTTSVTTFANNLNAGDFAFLDFENDGVYDHTGYISAMGSIVTVNGKTFKNFKVAQHTSNYHEWASSTTCSWENNSGKFAIMKAYY